MFVCCESCVLSSRGLCDELIPCPEESCRMWCVVVCDLEISRMRSHGQRWAAAPQEKKSLYDSGLNRVSKRVVICNGHRIVLP